MIESITTRTYKLTGTEPILGSSPASSDVRENYLRSKAPNASEIMDEEECYEDLKEKGLTVFPKNPKNGHIFLFDYQLRGFFKSALKALATDNGIKNAASKVDQFLFVSPRMIDIMRDEKTPVSDFDEIFERPLRGMTKQGPTVSLAASEEIYTPWEITITVSLLNNTGTKLSEPITWDKIERALDYGQYSGLMQFRNGGYGRFTWERVDKEA